MLQAVIDLSHFDTVTSFSQARQGGILAVIHKASQGTGYVDPTYATRRPQAIAAGLLWGAYHFATGDDPIAQVDHFLATAQPDAGTLLALDVENNPDGTTMTLGGAQAFLAEVTRRTGRPCVLYGGWYLAQCLQDAGAASPDPAIDQYPLWYAAYVDQPDFPPAWPQWTLWQYTDGVNGPGPHAVPGIQQCDRSAFNGDEAALRAFWPS